MKCDPHGSIYFNIKNVECSGLEYASKLQLQLFFYLIISKHVLLVETTFICLDIPIIHKN